MVSNKKSSEIGPQTAEQTIPVAQPTTKTETQTQEATVTITGSGFIPSTINIKAGTRVMWINKTGALATVNSAIHPTHRVFPPLNLGNFANESSVQFVFDKNGMYGYHNHLNPSQTGTVVVE